MSVAEIFNMYAQMHSAPAPEAKRRQTQLEKQIAPGRARNAATHASSQPEEKRQWTKSEIQTVYNAKAQYSLIGP